MFAQNNSSFIKIIDFGSAIKQSDILKNEANAVGTVSIFLYFYLFLIN